MLQNQSVYAVSSTSRCLFCDKYKTYIQCGQSVQFFIVNLGVIIVIGRV